MSGGSHNYICYQIKEYLAGQMHDRELDELAKDFAELAHDLEWCDSGDISDDRYAESKKTFKKKWLKGDRTARLKGIIDDAVNELRDELYQTIGIEPGEEKE